MWSNKSGSIKERIQTHSEMDIGCDQSSVRLVQPIKELSTVVCGVPEGAVY